MRPLNLISFKICPNNRSFHTKIYFDETIEKERDIKINHQKSLEKIE